MNSYLIDVAEESCDGAGARLVSRPVGDGQLVEDRVLRCRREWGDRLPVYVLRLYDAPQIWAEAPALDVRLDWGRDAVVRGKHSRQAVC